MNDKEQKAFNLGREEMRYEIKKEIKRRAKNPYDGLYGKNLDITEYTDDILSFLEKDV